MKNILIAVFLLGFSGINTGLFAQHLSVIESSRPCSINSKYTLYLEADPNACYGNSIQVVSNPSRAEAIDLGNGTGFAGAVPTTVSSTGWAYGIEVQSFNRNRDIRIQELVYTPNCLYTSYTTNLTIIPRVRLVPSLTDIELTSTSLCVGLLHAKAHDATMTSASTYSWTYETDPIASNAIQGYLYKPASTSINTSFTLGVTANNGCTSQSYSKTFDVYHTELMAEPMLVLPTPHYCSGTNNEFSINNPIAGIEYKWEFTANTPANLPASIEHQGPYQSLDMTTFTPDFGTNPIVDQGLVTSYTISLWMRSDDCDWVLVETRDVDNITYSPYCNGGGGSGARVMMDQKHTTSLTDHYSVSSSREVKTKNTQVSKLKNLENNGNVLSAYPNPTTGLVEVKSNGEKIEAVKVYNVTGTLVAQKLNIANTNSTLNLSSLPRGMYMVNVQTATTNKTIQVVKE